MTTAAAGKNRRKSARKPRPSAPADQVHTTVASVVDVELRERAPGTPGAWLADHITAFSGSLLFAALNAAWFGIWIIWNTGVFALPVFDAFPYAFLTFAVSLEAIFLATFVLISQNRQSERADRRGLVDLQVNVIAERELTKILELVAQIHERVGAGDEEHDPEVADMLKRVRVEDLERVTASAEDAARRS